MTFALQHCTGKTLCNVAAELSYNAKAKVVFNVECNLSTTDRTLQS